MRPNKTRIRNPAFPGMLYIGASMSREQTFALKILLFISGFAILSLEIVGIRILGPYVGTTVPVWAALMCSILFGSAAGYYGGGVLADRIQKREIFVWIAASASAGIMLIPASRGVMSLVSVTSYGIGALIGSLFLFVAPVMLLSALTTYTIRVFVKDIDTVARVHGDRYALVTAGSVAGVFGTSYLLVPLVTVPHILYILGVVLFVCGAFATLSFPHAGQGKGKNA